MRRLVATCLIACMLGSVPPAALAAKPPASWDGLSLIPSKNFDAVYLLPGADFRTYTKVMIDPTEVAFQKNWIRDYNSSTMDLSSRISASDAQKIVEKVQTGFGDVFHKAYEAAGYQIVTAPGPDVLRVRTGVANLSVSAPDKMTAGRSASFAREAGAATVILEVRDSLTGALLGRAVDSKTAGDNGAYLRNSVTNRSDFMRMFGQWAKISVSGFAELKSRSPIEAGAQ